MLRVRLEREDCNLPGKRKREMLNRGQVIRTDEEKEPVCKSASERQMCLFHEIIF